MTRDGKTTQGDLGTSEAELPLIANGLSQTWRMKFYFHYRAKELIFHLPRLTYIAFRELICN